MTLYIDFHAASVSHVYSRSDGAYMFQIACYLWPGLMLSGKQRDIGALISDHNSIKINMGIPFSKLNMDGNCCLPGGSHPRM
jgi:hypothetical protein